MKRAVLTLATLAGVYGLTLINEYWGLYGVLIGVPYLALIVWSDN